MSSYVTGTWQHRKRMHFAHLGLNSRNDYNCFTLLRGTNGTTCEFEGKCAHIFAGLKFQFISYQF